MWRVIATIVAWAIIVSHANAIVTAREELRANASDILLVSIISVEAKSASEIGNPCVTVFYISARVLAVNDTSTYVMDGDRITFGSYGVDTESLGCLGYAGPLPPPKLEAGWCGLVYLTQSGEGGLSLAAYGHSFVPTPDAAECLDVPVEATERDIGSNIVTTEVFVDDGKDSPGEEYKSRAQIESLMPATAWVVILFLIM